MRQSFFVFLVTFSAVFLAACQVPQQANIPDQQDDSQVMVDQDVNEVSMAVDDPFLPTLEAQLTDVTEGNDLSGGVNTGGASVGVAQAGLLEDGNYLLQVEIVGLPELPEGYFYEGWLVNDQVTPFSVVSSGELDNEDGVTYTNVFTSETNYTDHLEYVVTLEPRDGDPAPAEHVASGKFQQL